MIVAAARIQRHDCSIGLVQSLQFALSPAGALLRQVVHPRGDRAQRAGQQALGLARAATRGAPCIASCRGVLPRATPAGAPRPPRAAGRRRRSARSRVPIPSARMLSTSCAPSNAVQSDTGSRVCSPRSGFMRGILGVERCRCAGDRASPARNCGHPASRPRHCARVPHSRDADSRTRPACQRHW